MRRTGIAAAVVAVLAVSCLLAMTRVALSGAAPPVILAFGDSLTAGPGLARTETYPALLQTRLEAAGYSYRVVNAGVSGDTTTRALRRFEAALAPDTKILILALGINDGLRGVPVADVEQNLSTMIALAQKRDIKVLLCAMETPPLHGFDYTVEFHRMFARLGARFQAPLVPFFLFQIAGKPELNVSDGVHPNAAGHKLIAEAVWQYLQPMLDRTAR